MRVLVTGGSGFLGSHVVVKLQEAGHEPVCLVRKSSDTRFLEERGATLVVGAVDDAASLEGAVRGVDAVVHCAGLVKAKTYEDFLRVHEGGSLALFEAAKKHAPNLRRFVHVSTAGVMGQGSPSRPHREEDAPNPATPYSRSKLAGEQALTSRKEELPLTVLRPPAIYGPRDNEILAFFQMVNNTRMAFRFAGAMQSMSLVYGEDCAEACVLAVEKDVPSGSTYFLEDGSVYSFEDMARAIASALGVGLLGAPPIPRGIISAAAFGSELFEKISGKTMIFKRDKLPELFMEHFIVDSQKAQRELGWQPKVKFREGAQTTAQWYREAGWL